MTLISDLLTGIISGISGAIAALVSVYLTNRSNRRLEHYNKHKYNLDLLEKAIRQAMSTVNQYSGRQENPFISEDSLKEEVNTKAWINYSIKNVMIETKSNQYTNISTIDTLLYKDIKNHWPDLYKKIYDWDGKLPDIAIESRKLNRTIYININKNINLYTENFKMRKVILTPVIPPKIITPSMEDKINSLCVDTLMLCIYNYVMDIQEDVWPNNSKLIKELGIADIIKKIADEVKIQSKNEIEKLQELLKDLTIGCAIIKEIEGILPNEKLPGNCGYI
jgi:MFS superfamily sulfate permease-like transporter